MYISRFNIYTSLPTSIRSLYNLIDKSNGWDKTIYIDGSEYNYTGFPGKTNEQLDPTFKSKARHYFKRECLKEHIDQGIIPLPFATLDSYFNNDF